MSGRRAPVRLADAQVGDRVILVMHSGASSSQSKAQIVSVDRAGEKRLYAWTRWFDRAGQTVVRRDQRRYRLSDPTPELLAALADQERREAERGAEALATKVVTADRRRIVAEWLAAHDAETILRVLWGQTLDEAWDAIQQAGN